MLYNVHVEHFVDFHLIEFVCFRLDTIRNRVARAYILIGKFDMVYGYVFAAQICPTFLEILLACPKFPDGSVHIVHQ